MISENLLIELIKTVDVDREKLWEGSARLFYNIQTSVADPDQDPSDPYVFGPP
jgi:hypothetical protein